MSATKRIKPSAFLAKRRNWLKGAKNFCADTGPCCMMGAVWRSRPADRTATYAKIRDHVGMCPYTWNDAPARTHAEVIAALKACGL